MACDHTGAYRPPVHGCHSLGKRLPVETHKQLGHNVYVFELHIKSLSTIHIRCIWQLSSCSAIHTEITVLQALLGHTVFWTWTVFLVFLALGSSGYLQETCTRLGPLTWEWWEAHNAPSSWWSTVNSCYESGVSSVYSCLQAAHAITAYPNQFTGSPTQTWVQLFGSVLGVQRVMFVSPGKVHVSMCIYVR